MDFGTKYLHPLKADTIENKKMKWIRFLRDHIDF